MDIQKTHLFGLISDWKVFGSEDAEWSRNHNDQRFYTSKTLFWVQFPQKFQEVQSTPQSSISERISPSKRILKFRGEAGKVWWWGIFSSKRIIDKTYEMIVSIFLQRSTLFLKNQRVALRHLHLQHLEIYNNKAFILW